MATPADLKDPTFRDSMQAAEGLLDEGDYTDASRALAETYMTLLDKRPDLMPAPAGGDAASFAVARANRARMWPQNGGITIVYDDGGKPSLSVNKERFSMSEAYGYFEFMMSLLWDLQNEARRQ